MNGWKGEEGKGRKGPYQEGFDWSLKPNSEGEAAQADDFVMPPSARAVHTLFQAPIMAPFPLFFFFFFFSFPPFFNTK